MHNWNRESGSSTLEFTMVGVPLTFLLFSIANMSFAMLTMHTVQEAVEQAARYVVTHGGAAGSNCASGDTCTLTVGQIAGVIQSSAAGVNPGAMTVNLCQTATSGTCSGSSPTWTSCSPLSSCTSSSTEWPPSGTNAAGNDVIITADVTVTAPMFMFWTGVAGSSRITSSTFHAYSRQRIQF